MVLLNLSEKEVELLHQLMLGDEPTLSIGDTKIYYAIFYKLNNCYGTQIKKTG